MKKIMLLMIFALSVLMCSVQKDEKEVIRRKEGKKG